MDRTAGHLVEGSPIGCESNLPGHFGCLASQKPCQARHVESNNDRPAPRHPETAFRAIRRPTPAAATRGPTARTEIPAVATQVRTARITSGRLGPWSRRARPKSEGLGPRSR